MGGSRPEERLKGKSGIPVAPMLEDLRMVVRRMERRVDLRRAVCRREVVIPLVWGGAREVYRGWARDLLGIDKRDAWSESELLVRVCRFRRFVCSFFETSLLRQGAWKMA